MKYYTGIGSRKTPDPILTLMQDLATHLSSKNYILRSGHANGADQAFEKGAHSSSLMEIYLPWSGFNKSMGYPEHIDITNAPGDIYAKAEAETKVWHPAWDKCSPGARKLHTRNVFQVFGTALDRPSEFVICWTENGSGSGGTGQAIRIANAYKIPVIDLGSDTGMNQLEELLKSI